jgi:hypothetical protein
MRQDLVILRPDGVLTEVDVIDVLRLPAGEGLRRVFDLRDAFVCRVRPERIAALVDTAHAYRDPAVRTAIVARHGALFELAESMADCINARAAAAASLRSGASPDDADAAAPDLPAAPAAAFADVNAANRWLGTEQWDQLELLRARLSEGNGGKLAV